MERFVWQRRQWEPIDEASRLTIAKMEEAGIPPLVVQRRPNLPSDLMRILDRFYGLGRDFYGRPLVTEQVAELDEMGVHERERREEIRALWAAVANEEARLTKEESERKSKQKSPESEE